MLPDDKKLHLFSIFFIIGDYRSERRFRRFQFENNISVTKTLFYANSMRVNRKLLINVNFF